VTVVDEKGQVGNCRPSIRHATATRRAGGWHSYPVGPVGL